MLRQALVHANPPLFGMASHLVLPATAATCSPQLRRVSYLVHNRAQLDDALAPLMLMPQLGQLEVIVRNFTLTCEHLRQIGAQLSLQLSGICTSCTPTERLAHTCKAEGPPRQRPWHCMNGCSGDPDASFQVSNPSERALFVA
jgi:hypothetical protein